MVQGYTKQLKAILREHGWSFLRAAKAASLLPELPFQSIGSSICFMIRSVSDRILTMR